VQTVFQQTVTWTRTWLQGIFRESIFGHTYSSPVTFRYREEIKVWRRLAEISFPVEYGWKESLMGDLEGRIKQVPEVRMFFSGGIFMKPDHL